MAEADFSLFAFLRRRSSRLPEVVSLDIVSQLFEGVSAVHTRSVVHRDLKPSNVLIAVRPDESAPSIIAGCEHVRLGSSSMHVWLADFSRAVEFENISTPAKPSDVCSPGYCAPERLVLSQRPPAYGPSFDMWSVGVVAYEVFTHQPFVTVDTSLPPKTSRVTLLENVFRRLGDWPEALSYVMPPTIAKQGKSQPAKPWRFDDSRWAVLAAEPVKALAAVLRWEPLERATAEETLRCLRKIPRLGNVKLPVAPQEQIQWLTPAPPIDPTVLSHRRKHCLCSGHCMNPGHRRHGCQNRELVQGTNLCVSCLCTVPECNAPRYDNAQLCSYHARIASKLSWEWIITRETRSCLDALMPCDVEVYLQRWNSFKDDLASVIMIAAIKEPTPIEAWARSGVMGRAHWMNYANYASILF